MAEIQHQTYSYESCNIIYFSAAHQHHHHPNVFNTHTHTHTFPLLLAHWTHVVCCLRVVTAGYTTLGHTPPLFVGRWVLHKSTGSVKCCSRPLRFEQSSIFQHTHTHTLESMLEMTFLGHEWNLLNFIVSIFPNCLICPATAQHYIDVYKSDRCSKIHSSFVTSGTNSSQYRIHCIWADSNIKYMLLSLNQSRGIEIS